MRRVSWNLCRCGLFALWGLCRPALAEDPAERALAEGLPEIAVTKLQQRLEKGLSFAERDSTLLQLAEAQLAAGASAEALETLRDASPGARTDFLRARSYAALGRWNEAQATFARLADGGGSFADAARFGEAECWHALGDAARAAITAKGIRDPTPSEQLRLCGFYLDAGQAKGARALLPQIAPGTEMEKKWHRYLRARLLLEDDQPAPALAEFNAMLAEPAGLTESMFAGVTLGLSEAQRVLHGSDAADAVLERFISEHFDSAWLPAIFRHLDRIYAQQEDPSDSELQKWLRMLPARRGGYAAYYLARSQIRAEKIEKALGTLNSFTAAYPGHPFIAEAAILRGDVLRKIQRPGRSLGAYEEAMRAAPDDETLARAELGACLVHFQRGDFLLAATMATNAAFHSPSLREIGTFDAALAWLRQGNMPRFVAAYQELSAAFPESNLRRSLVLEEALVRARTGDPRAGENLRRYLRDFPEHWRVSEGRVALAELSFAAGSLPEANEYLRVANTLPANEAAAERADYLAIFLADAAEPRDTSKVRSLAETFLQRHADSELRAPVRMKLGQLYFEREDFANAQTQFELLAREDENSRLAEKALFLAGRAAMRSMSEGSTARAFELFQRVFKLNGDLRLYARLEQAQAQVRLGQENTALSLFDEILAAKPERDVRFASLIGKGDALLSLATKEEKNYVPAMAAFDQLVADPEATPSWRHEALYKKARALQRQKHSDEALTALYEVLEPSATPANEPEYLWFYKAGFEAAAMLEAQQKWKGAIAILEKMAAVAGPRAEEAKQRAKRLRLEHFVWE